MGNHIICHHCRRRRSVTPQESKKIRILLVGLDNAGKTTAAKGLVGEPVAAPAPTLGFSRLELRRHGWTVELYDVGGGRGIRGIWRNYLAESHGLAFVVDASDATRTDECRAVLHGLLQDDRVRGKPVLVLANKQDEPSALDEVELNERLQLEAAANEHRCPMRIELCCARLGAAAGKKRHLDVQMGFNWLTDYVIENNAALEARVAADLAVRAAELEQQRWARDERVRRSREAAAAAAAAASAAEDAQAEVIAAEEAPSAAPPEEVDPAETDGGQPEPAERPATRTGPSPPAAEPASPGPTPAPAPAAAAAEAAVEASPPGAPLQPELEAQIQEVFTRTEMGRFVREREAADGSGGGGGKMNGDESAGSGGGKMGGDESAGGGGGGGRGGRKVDADEAADDGDGDGGSDGGEAVEVHPVVLHPAATNGRSPSRELSPDPPVLEKDSGQGSIKESDSEPLTSSDASQLSAKTNGIGHPKRRNRFFKRYTKTAPMPDDVLLSLPSTPPAPND